MRLGGEIIVKLWFFLEVEGQCIFGDESVLIGNGLKDDHFIIFGLVVIIMLIIDMD